MTPILRRSRFYLSEVLFFDRSKLNWMVALRNSLGIGIAVILGTTYLSKEQALALIVGALQTSFYDNSDAYNKRAFRLFNICLFSSLGVLAASLASTMPWIAGLIAVLGAFASGMALAVSTQAFDVSVITMVTFLMFAAHPIGFAVALPMAGFIFLGGMLQSALSLLFWRMRRYHPEQRALALLFRELIPLVNKSIKVSEIPTGSAESIRAQEVLAAIANDPRDKAFRYRALVGQAERLRVSLIAAAKFRKRLERDESPEALEHLKRIDAFRQALTVLLGDISELLYTGRKPERTNHSLRELEVTLAAARTDALQERTNFAQALNRDILKQMNALAGMLRACVKLASGTTEIGQMQRSEKEAARPLKLRFLDPINGIVANLTWHSIIFRHAVRVAVCILIGEMVSQSYHLERPYWVPMTILLVLRPAFSTSLSRGLMRVGGTLAGLLIATAVVHWLPFTAVSQIILTISLTYLCRSLGAANYGIYAIGISSLIVVLFSISGIPPGELIWWRGLNTLLGGAIAVLSYWVWPNSERRDIPPLLAQLLASYRDYTRLVFQAARYEGELPINMSKLDADLDEVRRTSRVQRFNLKTMITRAVHEKNAVAEERERLTAILATSNRYVHAIMGIEAVKVKEGSVDSEALKIFADRLVVILDALIAHLNEKRLTKLNFGLRAAYEAMIPESPENRLANNAFLVEADEATDALNTLSELVVQIGK